MYPINANVGLLVGKYLGMLHETINFYITNKVRHALRSSIISETSPQKVVIVVMVLIQCLESEWRRIPGGGGRQWCV